MTALLLTCGVVIALLWLFTCLELARRLILGERTVVRLARSPRGWNPNSSRESRPVRTGERSAPLDYLDPEQPRTLHALVTTERVNSNLQLLRRPR